MHRLLASTVAGLAGLAAAFSRQEMLLAINDDMQYNVAQWERFVIDNEDDELVQMFVAYEDKNVLKADQLSSAYAAYSYVFTKVPFASRLSMEAAFIHTNTNSNCKVQDPSAYVSIITKDHSTQELVYTDSVAPDVTFLTFAATGSGFDAKSVASDVWKAYSTYYTGYSDFSGFYAAMSNSFTVASSTAVSSAADSGTTGAAARAGASDFCFLGPVAIDRAQVVEEGEHEGEEAETGKDEAHGAAERVVCAETHRHRGQRQHGAKLDPAERRALGHENVADFGRAVLDM
ncbi:hypothetical protein KL905_004168 [Ogataea polymorpha]|nr:hypothetical protein KL937_003732 [Ogataea polymorpha]KAG7887563.1 hypothetical protein KL936_004260 [Ogataea polymorpha]KAG7890434.1 hypothetical protein KL908_004271 [Ogataea polymorpha]KAG7898999.1 hypothetical protein KL935_004007 [Ogataea polymorpha]KAG7903694.1 hypothetical protein KL907_003721 [Ogataea polymorpha]